MRRKKKIYETGSDQTPLKKEKVGEDNVGQIHVRQKEKKDKKRGTTVLEGKNVQRQSSANHFRQERKRRERGGHSPQARERGRNQ